MPRALPLARPTHRLHRLGTRHAFHGRVAEEDEWSDGEGRFHRLSTFYVKRKGLRLITLPSPGTGVFPRLSLKTPLNSSHSDSAATVVLVPQSCERTLPQQPTQRVRHVSAHNSPAGPLFRRDELC